jgi:hypothetical protein
VYIGCAFAFTFNDISIIYPKKNLPKKSCSAGP